MKHHDEKRKEKVKKRFRFYVPNNREMLMGSMLAGLFLVILIPIQNINCDYNETPQEFRCLKNKEYGLLIFQIVGPAIFFFFILVAPQLRGHYKFT